MSAIASIRKALETQLATVTFTGGETAYENVAYTPTPGVPFQQVTLLPASPLNPEMGSAWLENGLFQVNLFFPKDAGAGAAQAQAEAIRAAFPMAASFVSGGVIVNIIATPEIAPGRPDEDRYMIPVKIKFSSFIGG